MKQPLLIAFGPAFLACVTGLIGCGDSPERASIRTSWQPARTIIARATIAEPWQHGREAGVEIRLEAEDPRWVNRMLIHCDDIPADTRPSVKVRFLNGTIVVKELARSLAEADC